MSRILRNLLFGTAALVVIAAAGFATVKLTATTPVDAILAAETLPELEACRNDPNAFGCLQQATSTLAVEDPQTLNRFFITVADDHLGAHCYGAAEQLGAAVFAVRGLDALREGVPACETGFQHGLLIAAAKAGVDLDVIAGGCRTAMGESAVPERWTPSQQLTCMVGIGRAVAVTVPDIISGRDVCERILKDDVTEEDGKRKGIDFCVRGVVNDRMTPDTEVQSAIDQCVELGGTRAYGCLSLGLRIPGVVSAEKNLELARACAKLDPENGHYCHFALSDAIAERLTIRKLDVDPIAISICSMSDACASHYAKFVLSTSWDPQFALLACDYLDPKGTEICRVAVPDLTNSLIEQGHLPASKAIAVPASS